MPSDKVLKQKQDYVEELSQKLQQSVAGVVVSYKGINVADDTKLRRELRKAGVDYSVVKNTMLSRAAEKAGLEEMNTVLKGSTALALGGDDLIAAAKILSKFAEKNKSIDVKTGFVEGKVISVDQVKALAKMPPKEELLARALGGLNAPITGFASVLHANLRGFAVVINAIAEKQGA